MTRKWPKCLEITVFVTHFGSKIGTSKTVMGNQASSIIPVDPMRGSVWLTRTEGIRRVCWHWIWLKRRSFQELLPHRTTCFGDGVFALNNTMQERCRKVDFRGMKTVRERQLHFAAYTFVSLDMTLHGHPLTIFCTALDLKRFLEISRQLIQCSIGNHATSGCIRLLHTYI